MNRLYSSARWTLAFLLCAFLAAPQVLRAQSDFENAISQYGVEQMKGYSQPLIDLLGANINAGHYRSAAIPTFGLTIQLDIVVMGSNVAGDLKEYDMPLPWGGTTKAPTVFGDPTPDPINNPVTNQPYYLSGGIVKSNFFPFAAPQVRVGSIFGTEGTLRYFSTAFLNNEAFPETKLFGFGIRHSISQWFDFLPLDVAAGYFYDKVTSESLIDFESSAFGIQASTSLPLLTIYGGVQWESSKATVTYNYNSGPTTIEVKADFEGKNKFRFTGGAALSLGIITLFADANFGQVLNFSGGVGFGF